MRLSPSRWRRWGRSLVEAVRDVDRDNIVIIAAGLAFFALLSGTPLLVAVISIYGLVSDPAVVERQINALGDFMPEDVRLLLAGQLRQIVHTSAGSLGVGAAVSIVTALWVGSKGVFYLFRALNIAYRERETRGFVRLKLIAFFFTVGLILTAVVAIGLVAVLPRALDLLGLDIAQERLFALGRWPVLGGGFLVGLALLYHFGPDRKGARFRWAPPGAPLVAVAWVVTSLLFSWFVETFGKLNQTYGSLGTAIALNVWFFLTAFLVLFGATLSAKREE